MANVKGNALPVAGSINISDLLIVVNPATGVAYQTTVSAFLQTQEIGKTIITTVAEETELDWSAVIPGETRTYAEKHGVKGVHILAETPTGNLVVPDMVIARASGNIATITISYLETGSRIIIL